MHFRNSAFTLVSLAMLYCLTARVKANVKPVADAQNDVVSNHEARDIHIDVKLVVDDMRDNGILNNHRGRPLHGLDVHAEGSFFKIIANDEDRLFTCCNFNQEIWDGTDSLGRDKDWAINQLATRCLDVCNAVAGWDCDYNDACKTPYYRSSCTECEGRALCGLFQGTAKAGSQSCD